MIFLLNNDDPALSQVVGAKAPRGRPAARLSSPLPSASSSSEEVQQEEEQAGEDDAVLSDDDYQEQAPDDGSEEEETQERREESEEEDAVADEELLTAHPLPEIGLAREGKVYQRGPSGFPERRSHGVLYVTSDA